MICNDNNCFTGRSYVGKMTELNLWFTNLDLYNVSMLSSCGCGLAPITEHISLTILAANNVLRISSIDQECRNGQGKDYALSVPTVCLCLGLLLNKFIDLVV